MSLCDYSACHESFLVDPPNESCCLWISATRCGMIGQSHPRARYEALKYYPSAETNIEYSPFPGLQVSILPKLTSAKIICSSPRAKSFKAVTNSDACCIPGTHAHTHTMYRLYANICWHPFLSKHFQTIRLFIKHMTTTGLKCCIPYRSIFLLPRSEILRLRRTANARNKQPHPARSLRQTNVGRQV